MMSYRVMTSLEGNDITSQLFGFLSIVLLPQNTVHLPLWPSG